MKNEYRQEIMSKCFNRNFLWKIIMPLILLASSIYWVVIGGWNEFVIFTTIISLIATICLIWLEPIIYIIDENEIKIICIFKQYRILNDQIKIIKICDDPYWGMSNILPWNPMGYWLHLKKNTNIPERYRYIYKYSKTKRMVEIYYDEKIFKGVLYIDR